MKKTAIYYFSLAAILAGSFSSCREADLGFNEVEISKAAFEKEYKENFELDYGKIAPGHTWGFLNPFGTRADGADPTIIDPYPGVSNQYRLTRNSNGSVNKAAHIGEGGGTDEDILSQYAYNYAPPAITAEEITYVRNYVNSHPNEGFTECPMNNYFIQNLGVNPHEYDGYFINNAGTEHEEKLPRKVENGHMDYLFFDDVHFESFNNGDGFDYFVSNTNIKKPSYHDSNSKDNPEDPEQAVKIKNEYDVEYSHIGKRVFDAYRYYLIPGYGLYLCFDYATNSQNGAYDGDGRYDDWILKITPGLNEKFRVFCEDLGSTLDLDFNDLVFEYAFIPGINKISIEIKSLGGTLPISLGGKDLKGDNLTCNLNVTNNVGSETLNRNIPVFYLDYSTIESVPIIVKNNQRGECFIANTTGGAPYLLRVPANTAWPGENVRIETVYSDFKFYVTNGTPFWWGNLTDYPNITPGN